MESRKIQPDKWKHFLVGILLGAILQALSTYLFSFSTAAAAVISLAGTAAISYGFELFSLLTRRGKYELLDAVASAIGGVLGIVGMIILQIFF